MCYLTSVTDADDEMYSLPASDSGTEAVCNGRLVDSGSQSSCTVNVIKLDWESFSEHHLAALAASVDTIIATGLFYFFA